MPADEMFVVNGQTHYMRDTALLANVQIKLSSLAFFLSLLQAEVQPTYGHQR